MSKVSLRGVAYRQGAFSLSGVDLELPQGSVTALQGASGSGKSTLLRLIAGFVRPDAGEIWLDEACVASPRVMVPANRRKVGLVFQNYALFPHLTVERNILFGSREMHAARREILAQWMERLGIASLAGRYPHEISGGEQQRVALARALVAKPRVLLMDEPFANLDADLRRQVRDDAFRIVREQCMTTLLVTHDTQEAKEVAAERLFSLSKGMLRISGESQQ